MEAKCEHLSVFDFEEGLEAGNTRTSGPLAMSLTAAKLDQAPAFDAPV